MVNTIKKFTHIALKRIAHTRVIFTLCSKHLCDFLYTFMRSFSYPARKGGRDKSRLKNRIKNFEYRMVKHPVCDRGLMYSPQFRIMNPKPVILPMLVNFVAQVMVKTKDVLFELSFEFSNIGLVPLVALKNTPSGEKIFWRNY